MFNKLFFLLSAISLTFSALAQEQETTKVGVILPLTGPLSAFGVAFQNGITLAQRAEGGALKGITFEYEDSQYNPQTAITIFRKFAADPKVAFVINFGCPTSQAIAPIAEQTKTPTAFLCSSPLLTKGKQFSFGMCSPSNEWATILWRYLGSKDFKELCLVLTENDYLVGEYNSLQSEMKKQGGNSSITVIDQFTPQETDFKTSVTKLASKQCDALGVYMLPGQVRTFFDQSRHLELKSQIFGTDIFEDTDEIKASNGGMEGAVFVNLAVPATFRELYRAEFHNDILATMACITHDLVLRLGAALKKEESKRSPVALMQSIQSSGDQLGACGRSSFVQSETGERFLRFPITLKRIVGGKIVEVES